MFHCPLSFKIRSKVRSLLKDFFINSNLGGYLVVSTSYPNPSGDLLY